MAEPQLLSLESLKEPVDLPGPLPKVPKIVLVGGAVGVAALVYIMTRNRGSGGGGLAGGFGGGEGQPSDDGLAPLEPLPALEPLPPGELEPLPGLEPLPIGDFGALEPLAPLPVESYAPLPAFGAESYAALPAFGVESFAGQPAEYDSGIASELSATSQRPAPARIVRRQQDSRRAPIGFPGGEQIRRAIAPVYSPERARATRERARERAATIQPITRERREALTRRARETRATPQPIQLRSTGMLERIRQRRGFRAPGSGLRPSPRRGEPPRARIQPIRSRPAPRQTRPAPTIRPPSRLRPGSGLGRRRPRPVVGRGGRSGITQ